MSSSAAQGSSASSNNNIINSSSRAVIKTSFMPSEMQERAVDITKDAVRDNYTDRDIASSIRTSFQTSYPTSVWHCFVGRDFGTFVSHEASKYIYFYVGQVGVCLFATS
mmetsp:Transcript_20061/g.24797  ORF Transcript_20061/g.24797 Transcript_20061/m.24797 type:complete len:109 (-) Transcript_20061:229-555(-)